MARTIRRSAEIGLGGERIAYTVHQVAGRRHVHLVIGEDGMLQVRAPWRFSLREADALVRSHARWVIDSLREARELRARRPRLESGAALPLVDERLWLRIGGAPRSRVVRVGATLHVERAPAPGAPGVRELLERWYRRQAQEYLPPRLHALARELGVTPRRVSIRAQRTRWGSCSSVGGVSLNWRLMLLPSTLSDYVLVHELCHLRHMDHSAGFWALVEGLIPDYRERCRRLRGLETALAL